MALVVFRDVFLYSCRALWHDSTFPLAEVITALGIVHVPPGNYPNEASALILKDNHK
jgi:hypothetical protein